MGMSASTKVSRLCGEIDDKVNGFLDRPLEGDWPYLVLLIKDAAPAPP